MERMEVRESTAKYTTLTRRPNRKRCIQILVIGIILLIIIIIAVIIAVKQKKNVCPSSSNVVDKASKFLKAAVAADSTICSQVGSTILEEGGNAIDGAIASLLCGGVINFGSSGIGGGGFFVFYQRKDKRFYVFDYRETAPSNATENMYVNNTDGSRFGGLSIAIPGQVKGLFSIHQAHGKLNWSSLVEPAIKLAEEGFVVTKALAKAMKMYLEKGVSENLRKLVTKPDGKYYEEYDLFKNPLLAKTLRNIQANGSKDFYEGELAKQIIEDIQNASGIITLDDLKNYKMKTRTVLSLQLSPNLTLQTMPAPGGGPILAMIANIMSGYNYTNDDFLTDEGRFKFNQRLIEAMKYSYAQRGLLGDPEFLPAEEIKKISDYVVDPSTGSNIRNKIFLNETYAPSHYGGSWTKKGDHGTTHLSVLAENGDAVSVTDTINYGFGSKVYSPVTGILYNNEMDDFSTPGVSNLYGYPPTPANFIRPGKRPLSSMSPTIITDKKGDVIMVAGASGGSRIISGTAQVILRKVFLNQPLGASVSNYRLHHQGIPNKVMYFDDVAPPNQLVQQLKDIGHDVEGGDNFSVSQAIYKSDDGIFAMSDEKKQAKPAGY